MIATINLVLSWVLVLLFLITQSMNKKWSSLISFIVTFTILYFSRCDLSISLVLAFLVAFLSNLFLTKTNNHHESFENPEEETTPKSEEEEDKDSFIDVGKTFLQAYKSLTPGQIETMTTDTKELIDTQKNLLETIKTLAPIVTEGKKMLDTFKDYFGDHTSVIQQLKSASDIMKPK
jgi:Ca2+/Na+ antiporter